SYPSKFVNWPISTSSASKPSHRNNGHEQKLRLQTSKNLINEQQESSRPNRRDFFLFKGDRASTYSLSVWTDRASNDGKTGLLLKRLRLSPLLLRLSPPLLRSKRHSFRFGQCGFLHC